jgi:hypothetical protein
MSARFDLPTITQGLAALRRRARASLGLQGGATLAVLLISLCLLSFGLDRTLRLSWEVRATALVAILTALGWVLWGRLLLPLRADLGDAELARLVEREHPQLEWRLLSAVQFADPAWEPGPHTSLELANLVVADAERLAAEVEFGAPVPSAPMVRSATRGGAVTLAAALLLATFPGPAATWFERNVLLSTTAEWPKDTLLELQGPPLADGAVRLARGEDLTFVVLARGVIPSRVYLDTVSAVDGSRERLVLDALGDGRFRTTLEQVSESFEFTLWGGDDELGPFQAQVIRRPWITDLAFAATPPAYTGQAPRAFGVEAGALTLPQDTAVEVRVGVSKPLVKAWLEELRPGEGGVARIHTGVLVPDGEGFTASLTLDQAGAGVFRVLVEDGDGYGFEQPTRFNLIAQSDAAPELKLRLLGVGLNVTPKAKIRFAVDARDDYQLTSGALQYKGAGGDAEAEVVGGLPLDEILAGKVTAAPSGVLDLASLELKPKMSLTLWAEATDSDPRGPNTGASPSHQVRIVTAEQLLNELLRRLHEQRLELERMISEEEKLAQGLSGRDETTLERAARTHADVSRTVTRAADVVDGVVEELTSNDLLERNVWDRLRDDVAAELRRVAADPLQEARDLADGASQAQGADREQLMLNAGSASLRVVSELRAIVVRMGDIEDMAELVAMLKKIIEQQRGLMDKNKRRDGR